jgi:hypothetical protein
MLVDQETTPQINLNIQSQAKGQVSNLLRADHVIEVRDFTSCGVVVSSANQLQQNKLVSDHQSESFELF